MKTLAVQTIVLLIIGFMQGFVTVCFDQLCGVRVVTQECLT